MNKPWVKMSFALSTRGGEEGPLGRFITSFSIPRDGSGKGIPIHRLMLQVCIEVFLYYAKFVAGGDVKEVQSAWNEFLKLANTAEWKEEEINFGWDAAKWKILLNPEEGLDNDRYGECIEGL